MDQTNDEFRLEIEELLDRIYVDLDSLRDTELGGPRQRELINQTFRHVHSVKGSSASGGLHPLTQMAHELENLLDAARAGRIVLDDVALDACASATDALSNNLGLSPSESSPPDSVVIDKLRALLGDANNGSDADPKRILNRIQPEIWQDLTEAERFRLVSAVSEGSGLFLISTSFDATRFDKEFFSLKEKLVDQGEVLSTSPTIDPRHPDKINFRVLYATQATTVTQLLDAFPEVTIRKVELGAKDEEVASVGSSSSVSSMSNFIRTDLNRLDSLISSAHELFRRTANAFELASNQQRDVDLQSLHEQIKSSFLEVEEELINLRMVALTPTLERAARAGRAAARLSGKKIDFKVAGGELQIDKLLADAIADPLIHLCRNAVAHGIEDAKARAAAGKPARGLVHVEALSEGGRVRVRVTDDGRGIDPHIISTAAKRLGLFESAAPLDFERSLRMIFRPGFTTVEAASDLSGRGVGLDVVETAVEQSGGELRVSSNPGAGTIFEIRLPVTFGLMEATVVVAGGNRYCIAASQTSPRDEKISSAEPRHFSLQELLGSPVKQTVSLRPAADAPTDKNSQQPGKVITCQFSEDHTSGATNQQRRVAIVVDEIEGTEKVLVRTLGRHAGRWYGVAGATELRDGSVALVLDLPRLLSGME